MPDFNLILRGGSVVTPSGLERLDVGIQGGKIAALGKVSGTAREEQDVSGLHLLPGVVDAHVHFNEPGRAEWEGFATGSAAFAAGGGTTFIDMPLNSSPPTLDRASFEAKKAAAEGASLTDFSFWGGLTPENLEHLPDLAALGVVGFKAFMSSSGIDDFHAVDDLTLYEGMKVAAELGLPVAVHAESDPMTAALSARIRAGGGKGIRDYLNSRPVIAELEAINRALFFAQETGADLHIVHVSSARGVALVSEAKAQGVRVTCETCPHYLYFTEEDLERSGAILKCAPPLRTDEERLALWQSVVGGEVDLIASDHSPSPADLKERDDFFAVWGGIAGVQSTLAVMLTEGLKQGLTLLDTSRLLSRHPAERFGLKGKGKIAAGYDADLVLVDLEVEERLEHLYSRHKLSPYAGETFRGVVRATLLRGERVYERDTEGHVRIAQKPLGRFVRREDAF